MGVQHGAVAGNVAAATAAVPSRGVGSWGNVPHGGEAGRGCQARSDRGHGHEDSGTGQGGRAGAESEFGLPDGSNWAATHGNGQAAGSKPLDRGTIQEGRAYECAPGAVDD